MLVSKVLLQGECLVGGDCRESVCQFWSCLTGEVKLVDEVLLQDE